MTRFVAGAFLLIAAISAAQQPKRIEPNQFSHPLPKVAHGPAEHLDISNSTVRAYRIKLAAHATATIHSARGYVLLAISGGQAQIGATAQPYQLNLQAGEAEVFKGGWPQQLHSTSDAASEWVVVEPTRGILPERAICGLNGSTCGTVKFGKTDDGEYDESTLFETPTVKLSRAKLGPNSVLATHADRMDHVIVPTVNTAYQLNGARVADGTPKWVRGSAELRTGAQGENFLILEIK